jgi:hypothetical protein
MTTMTLSPITAQLLEAAETAATLCDLITKWAEADRDDAFDIMDEIVAIAQDNEQPKTAVSLAKGGAA